MIIETGSDGEGSISSTPSSASNEALRKAKKRKPAATAPAPANEGIEASVRAASNALKEITSRRDHEEYPPDVRGFLMTLGADLASITDVRTRKLLMMEIQALTIRKMFPEPRAAPTTSQPVDQSSRPASAPPPAWHDNANRDQNFSYTNFLLDQ